MSKNHEGETAMNEQENKAKQLFKESASAKEAAKNAWKFSMDDSLSDREKLHQLGAKPPLLQTTRNSAPRERKLSPTGCNRSARSAG